MLSVLTFNLRFGLANDGPNNWSRRKKAFPSLLKTYQADFISFQEANDFQTDFLKKILNEYNVIGEKKAVLPFWQNNIIFYKKTWKCVYHEHFFLSPTPTIPSRSRKSRWPRQCTMGIFKKEDMSVICINTHFDFDAEVQTESARIITERLSHLPSDLPAFLMGDFNASPSDPCYKIFTEQIREPTVTEGNFKNIFEEPCSDMMQTLHKLPQPVIAQVHGIATAAGCQIVAACDLAIAETGAQFATPGVKIGLFCSTPMVPLSRVIGRRRALDMLLSGRFISAEEAEKFGLVNKVTDPDKLAEETEKWAMEFAQYSLFTLEFGKKAFYTQADWDEPSAYNYAKEAIAINCLAEDAQEGMKAFVEKREPEWKDR